MNVSRSEAYPLHRKVPDVIFVLFTLLCETCSSSRSEEYSCNYEYENGRQQLELATRESVGERGEQKEKGLQDHKNQRAPSS